MSGTATQSEYMVIIFGLLSLFKIITQLYIAKCQIQARIALIYSLPVLVVPYACKICTLNWTTQCPSSDDQALPTEDQLTSTLLALSWPSWQTSYRRIFNPAIRDWVSSIKGSAAGNKEASYLIDRSRHFLGPGDKHLINGLLGLSIDIVSEYGLDADSADAEVLSKFLPLIAYLRCQVVQQVIAHYICSS